MKKRNLKSLKLNKKSISNLQDKGIKGGQNESIIVIWSIHSCPTMNDCPTKGCTQKVCDISIPFTACISQPFHNC